MQAKFNKLKNDINMGDAEFAAYVTAADSGIPLFGAPTDAAQLKQIYKALGRKYPY